MKKQLTFIYGILLVMTMITAFLTRFSINKTVVVAILFFSGIKFLLVAFHFMELKDANAFWKTIVTLFLVLFIGIIVLII